MAVFSCPSPSTPQWQYLTKDLGLSKFSAYRVFINTSDKNGEFPSLEILQNIMKNETSTVNDSADKMFYGAVKDMIVKIGKEQYGDVETTVKQKLDLLKEVRKQFPKEFKIKSQSWLFVESFLKKELGEDISIPSISNNIVVGNEDVKEKETTEDNADETEVANNNANEAPDTDEKKRIKNLKERYKPFINELKKRAIQEPENVVMDFAKAAKQWRKENKDYNKDKFIEFLEKYRDVSMQSDLMISILYNGLELSDERFSSIISLVNEYGSLSFRDIVMLVRRTGQNVTSWVKQLLNKEDTYANYENRLETTLRSFVYNKIADPNKSIKAYWDKFIEDYNAIPSLKGKEVIAENVQKKFDMANDFLQQITGLRWDEYYNSENEELYEKEGNTYKRAVFTAKEFRNKLPNLYRKATNGTMYPALSSTMTYYLLELKDGNNKYFQDNNPVNALIKYFTVPVNPKDTWNQLRKLTNHLDDRRDIPAFSFNNKREMSLEMDSHFATIFDRLEKRFKDGRNELAQYFIKNKPSNKKDEPGYIQKIQGIRGYREVNGERQKADLDAFDMSDDEILTSLLVDFTLNKDVYNHWLGVFGDKKKFYPMTIPKRNKEYTLKQKYDAIKEHLTDEEIAEFNKRVKSIINDSTKHDGVLNNLINEDKMKNFAYDFLYNYTLNMNDLNEMIHGNISTYKGLIDTIKRAGNILSTGVAPDAYVEGGLGEKFNHIIVDDPKYLGIKEFEDLEITDGMQLASDDAMDRAQVSFGIITSKGYEYEKMNSCKLNYSGIDDNNERHLNKCNTIRASSIGTELGDKIAQWMKDNKVDFITFKSGAKVTPKTNKTTKLFNDKNEIDFNAKPEFIELNTENLRFQQDLRHSVEPHTSKQSIQLIYNFLDLIESKKDEHTIITLNNLSQKEFQDNLEANFNADEYAMLKDIFKSSDFKAALDYINSKGSLRSPRFRKTIERKIAHYTTKNAFERKTNRVALQRIPAFGIKLRIPEVITYNGEKVVRLGQCACNIEGIRYDEPYDMTLEQAINHINNNKHIYPDMIYVDKNGKQQVRAWELEEVDGKTIIPGEFVIYTRVPAGNCGATVMARAHKRLKGADNYLMLDSKSYKLSGEDFDGDKRFGETFFRKGKFITRDTKTFEGRANMNLLLYGNIFYDVKNFERINYGIDKHYFDDLLTELESTSAPIKNPVNVIHILNAYNSNRVGRQAIGITANLNKVFDLCAKYGIGINTDKNVSVSFDNRKLSVTGIASDKYGHIKGVINDLLNLTLDNANEQIIDKLGYNEITSKLAIFLISSDKELDNILDEEKYKERLKDRAYDTVRYLLTPEVQAFIKKKRESRSSNAVVENDKKILDTLKKKYGDEKITQLETVWNAANEFSEISNIINITEEVAKDVYEFNNYKKTYEKLLNSLSDVPMINSPKYWYIDVKNFMNDRTGSLVNELQGLKRNIDFSEKHLYKDSLQNTSKARNIYDAFKYALLGANNDETNTTRYMNDNLLKRIGSFMDKYFLSSALGEFKAPNVLREYLIGVLNDKDKLYTDNKFLDSLQLVVEGDTYKIQILSMNYGALDDITLQEIWNDFDKLHENMKNAFYQYQLMRYGLSESLYHGSYLSLISPTYNSSISEKIDNVFEDWYNGFNNDIQEDLYVGLIDFYQNVLRTGTENNINFPLVNLEYLINKAINNKSDFIGKMDTDYKPLVYAINYIMKRNGITDMHPFDFINDYQEDLLGKKTYISDYRDERLYGDIKPSQAKMTSGGALGADQFFRSIAMAYGLINQFHYYHPGMEGIVDKGIVNKVVSKADIEQGQRMMHKAGMIKSEAEGKHAPNNTSNAGMLITRNWAQVKYSDAVYAVSKSFVDVPGSVMNKNNTNQRRIVSGGTGWAVQYAIMTNKPVFVFDQVTDKWYVYDKQVGDFIEYKSSDGNTVPRLTKNFAGIGTAKELKDNGKKAINDLFANTFPKKQDTIYFGENTPEHVWMMAGNLDYPVVTQRGSKIKSSLHYFWGLHVPSGEKGLLQQIIDAKTGADVVAVKNNNVMVKFTKEEDIKIMEDALRMKFKAYPELKQRLVNTGEAYLNAVSNDLFWGRAINKAGGQNHLGELLMKLRKEFKDSGIKVSEKIVTVYQGRKSGSDNRKYNYYTQDKEEAKDYGNVVEEKTVDTTGYLNVKENEEEYNKLRNEFNKTTGLTYDILNNSKEGLEIQEKFFEYLQDKGYSGLNYLGYSDTKYVVTFPVKKTEVKTDVKTEVTKPIEDNT